MFKHFPLDSVCNALVKREAHPRACEVARVAEAAHVQGQFWSLHEAMFMPRSGEELTLKALVEGLKLDGDRFGVDCQKDAGLAKVKADIDLGIQLGIDGTPSVFVNGRRVYDTRRQALQCLIAHEMERRDHTAIDK